MTKSTRTALLAACVGFISACTPTYEVRGNIIQEHQFTSVQAGVDTQSDVMRKLGSPTTRAPFDENVWYYLGQETEKRGILDPEVKNERIVAVRFNAEGIVETIEDIDSNRVDIPYARRKTPTSGSELTVMQQLLGNVGRFNKEEDAKKK